jgi:hypothetical protein
VSGQRNAAGARGASPRPSDGGADGVDGRLPVLPQLWYSWLSVSPRKRCSFGTTPSRSAAAVSTPGTALKHAIAIASNALA